MFINDVNKKDEIRNIAVQDLRKFGIKYRPKKISRHNVQEKTYARRIFKTALHSLPMQTVTLTSGQQLVVPKLVHDLCSFLEAKVETEGLFRKAGSKARQNEIKLLLDAGCSLTEEHHEIDVANVIKTFFRELPEPLIPNSFHETFLRCAVLQENKLSAVFLACLLLPGEHLNTLAYTMQFLHYVSEYSGFNKMDSYNIAVIIGPTLMPVEDKAAPNPNHLWNKVCEIFKLLIDNASNIGLLPENIIDRIAPSSSSQSSFADEDSLMNKKKKKRRSGSLTRMFSGLKKIVSSKSIEEVVEEPTTTPDLLSTPLLTKYAKKRKMDSIGFSNKKKRELLNTLPQGATLSTPYTPTRTPISVHPNPKRMSPPKSTQRTKNTTAKEKRSQWNFGSKRAKPVKTSDTNLLNVGPSKSMLERRWSAVSQAAGFRRNKKRNSCASDSPATDKTIEGRTTTDVVVHSQVAGEDDVLEEPDYVKISRTEYEEIKNRVSAIERRISLELETIDVDQASEPLVKVQKSVYSDTLDGIEKVQNAYEMTLDEAEHLSPTTDQLARRLSKELKIRHSLEQKVIRSPSARKIGILRRRSRELERHNTKLNRNQSWHLAKVEIIPRINLKRGKPNTLQSGLRQPSLSKNEQLNIISSPVMVLNVVKKTARASSFHGQSNTLEDKQLPNNSSNNSNVLSDKWTSAEGFFQTIRTPHSKSIENCRASIARIRNQNAGMVLAKAKLFDGLVDSDNSINSHNSTNSLPRIKMGAIRNPDRKLCRAKTLHCDDERSSKKTPRKRLPKSPTFYQQTQIGKNSKNIVITPTSGNYSDKENQANGDSLMIVDYLSNSDKLQSSVLKDCNRIGTPDLRLKAVSPSYVTPKAVPNIKKTLNVKSPRRMCRTLLRNENKQTPLKVLSSAVYNY